MGRERARAYLHPFAKDSVGDTEGREQVEEGVANRDEGVERHHRRHRPRPADWRQQHLPPAADRHTTVIRMEVDMHMLNVDIIWASALESPPHAAPNSGQNDH